MRFQNILSHEELSFEVPRGVITDVLDIKRDHEAGPYRKSIATSRSIRQHSKGPRLKLPASACGVDAADLPPIRRSPPYAMPGPANEAGRSSPAGHYPVGDAGRV